MVQVATIGIDPLTAKRAIEGVPDYCKTDYYCKKDNFLLPAKWNAKVAIATYQMLECWKGSCAEGMRERPSLLSPHVTATTASRGALFSGLFLLQAAVGTA